MKNLNKAALLLAVAWSALLVSGCSVEASVESKPTPDNVNGGAIEMVTLDDGTRCVVWDGFKAGGISCDWRGGN